MNYKLLSKEIQKIWPETIENFNEKNRKNLEIINIMTKDLDFVDKQRIEYKGKPVHPLVTKYFVFSKKTLDKDSKTHNWDEKQFAAKLAKAVKQTLEEKENKYLKKFKTIQTLIQINKPEIEIDLGVKRTTVFVLSAYTAIIIN